MYVLRNLKRVIRFLEKEENASLNLCYWLIDNGKTLSANKEISRLIEQYPDNFKIIENRNVGGAGCFTLGGSLLREDFHYIQQAAGEWFANFAVQNDFLLADLRKFEICTHEYMCEPIHKNIPYSGWWCCCMSLNVVNADNLPIPLFLHHDDIEFGIRNQKYGIVFLNGFSVWHKGFELTFPGVNTYYDIRNSLITTAVIESKQSLWNTVKWLWKRIIALLIEFRYEEMQLTYLAFGDFCKGPEWLYSVDAEKLNDLLRKQITLKPLENLKVELSAKDYREISLYIEQYRRLYTVGKIEDYFVTNWKVRKFIQKITVNGWLLPSNKKIIALSPIESPFDAFRRKRVVIFEPASLKAKVGKREYVKLLKAICMCLDIGISVPELLKAQKAYRKNINKITQINAWNKYLEIVKNQ